MIAYEAEFLRLPDTLHESYHQVYGELAFFVDDALCADFNAALDVAVKCELEHLREVGMGDRNEAVARSCIASQTVKIETRQQIWDRLSKQETCPRDSLLLLAVVSEYCGELYRAMFDEWAAFANLVSYRKKGEPGKRMRHGTLPDDYGN